MDFLDRLDSVKVVNTWVQANLVHDDDSRFLRLGVQLAHGGGNVARGDDMGLSLDGGLDNSGVKGVRDERNYQVVFRNSSLECRGIINVERHGFCVGQS
jgi:hypothetical protein